MTYITLIDAQFDNEIRIAHLKAGKLIKYQHYSAEKDSLCGNIYYGRLAKCYKHLDTAFIEIGSEKHGFIQNYHKDTCNLFQVVKDAKGKKCATLTKAVVLKGRYVNLHPYNDPAKSQVNFEKQTSCLILRDHIGEVRQEHLRRDAEKLCNIWQDILQKTRMTQKPGLLYQGNDVLLNTIKDLPYRATVAVEGKKTYHMVCKIAAEWAPDIKIRLYNRNYALFQHHNIESKIADLQRQHIYLPSGGSITINQTEALIAIDINSGKSGSTPYQINLEAALSIADQIRLRNLSGLIIVDFIDMNNRDKSLLYQKMKKLLEEDFSYTQINQVPNTGTVEITRQRILPSISENISVVCDRCDGTGFTLSTNSAAIQVLRDIRNKLTEMSHEQKVLTADVTHDIAQYLLNHCRSTLNELEERYRKTVVIRICEKIGFDFK